MTSVKTLFIFLVCFSSVGKAQDSLVTKPMRSKESYANGRLSTNYVTGGKQDSVVYGLSNITLDTNRKCLLYIPAGYSKEKPCKLAIMLHGSRGKAEQGMALLQKHADDHQIILVSPASKKESWDLLMQETFGEDALYIDQVLEHVFKNYHIDKTHIALGGFSDGASYSLCLGVTNGNLFTHILAFSPGFYYTLERAGKPSIFVSHGLKDAVLPINTSSRSIVRELKGIGLAVEYIEFPGFHEVKPEVIQKAVEWFTTP